MIFQFYLSSGGYNSYGRLHRISNHSLSLLHCRMASNNSMSQGFKTFHKPLLSFFYTLNQSIHIISMYQANAERSALMSIVPQKAIVAETGQEVDVNDVKIDTIIAIKAGESIPIDGIVVDGDCEVDEKTLTGESYPVAKNQDSLVYAGTINLNGITT